MRTSACANNIDRATAENRAINFKEWDTRETQLPFFPYLSLVSVTVHAGTVTRTHSQTVLE